MVFVVLWMGVGVSGVRDNNRIKLNKQSMRKSPVKKGLDKSRSPSRSKVSTGPSGAQPASSLYYCHYRNAMYMGGIRSFKKQGKGILLHDDGISAITSYHNDLLHGHNIFFDSYGLLSAVYNKHKLVECVYRTEGFLVFLPYGGEGDLDGKAVLLNYITKSIIYAEFRRGNMVDKSQQTDFTVLNRAFELSEIDFLIGSTHAKVMRYDFPKVPLMEAQRQGNRLVVGFEKNGFINGVGFSFVWRGAGGGYNPDTHRQEDEFQLRLLERGYYINTQLTGMGQKMFKNGNLYVGEFHNNVFQGHGVLKNSEKKSWVSGCFQNGHLVELIQYNSEGDDRKFRKIVEALHEKKTNWINNEIALLSFNQFVDEIEKIIRVAPNRHVKTLEERKQEVLKKIQEKFISDTNASFDQEVDESLRRISQQPTHTPNKTNSKRQLGDSIQSQEGISFQAPAFQPAGNSPGKIKLFQKSNNKASSSRISSPAKPQFSRSPSNLRLSSSGIKNRAYLNESQGDRERQDNSRERQDNSRERQDNSRERQQGSRELRKANTSGQLGLSTQGDRLDSKRMVGKNKIFKYLQKQEESSPKFIYTRINPSH